MSFAFRLSLTANIALVAAVAFLLTRTHFHPENAAVPSNPEPRSFNQPTAAADSRSIAPSEKKLNPTAVLKLEQMGISREAVANLVLQEFNLRSTHQLAQLQKKYAPRPVPEREMIEFSRRCEIDRVRELKETLGDTGYRDWDKEEKLHELNRARPPGDELALSASEAEQAYQLQKDFDEKAQSLHEAMEDGVADRADAGTLEAQAQQAFDAAMEKLLGKQRFDELHGIVDPSTQVQREYGALNPTPDQVSAVAQAEAAYREQQDALAKKLNQNPGDTANLTAQLKALNDAQNEKLRQIFGSAAYDKMKQQSDPTYQTLTHYADAWSLQDSDVQSAYQTIHAFQDSADQIRSAAEMSQAAGQPVNWRDVNANIAKVQQQAEANLQNQIGDERLRRLKQNGVLDQR